MARGDYGPEIKNAIGSGVKGKPRVGPSGESASDMARDVGAGIKEGSPQDAKLDAMPSNRPPSPGGVAVMAAKPPGGSAPPDLHHVAAATSIAHAILNRGGMGGGRMGGV